MESAKTCASLLLKPSCEAFYSVKQRLSCCDAAWLQEFLAWHGLTHLLDTLVLLGQSRDGVAWSVVSDAILQLDCVGCLREILNHCHGLDYVTQRPELISKLVLGRWTVDIQSRGAADWGLDRGFSVCH